MPNTMVQNIIGAISMVIMLMNTLLMVCAVGAKPLKNTPTKTPSMMAMITWKVKLVSNFFMLNKYRKINY